jgi:U3 small nucleolar RNA-associated protein 4
MEIHRCRFVPYPSAAINALAVSHHVTGSHNKSVHPRLAIGRANGDVEIWNCQNEMWHQEVVMYGGQGRSIGGLVWVKDPDEELKDGKVMPGRLRLFSIGSTATVTEWDLEKGKPKRHASGQHGDIWCLEAQPGAKVANEVRAPRKLLGGTIDGALVLYSIEDDDLVFQSVLARTTTKKVRMVSMTFQSNRVCVVGCADSAIRAYDLRDNNSVKTINVGSDRTGGSKKIIVWAVKCLPNGDIVSGDSTGHISIFDAKSYAQLQRVQGHKQDVLSLIISNDGSRIFSGGMDRRTVAYKKAGERWAALSHSRYHSHDVKALTALESGKLSVVVSGGEQPIVVVGKT